MHSSLSEDTEADTQDKRRLYCACTIEVLTSKNRQGSAVLELLTGDIKEYLGILSKLTASDLRQIQYHSYLFDDKHDTNRRYAINSIAQITFKERHRPKDMKSSDKKHRQDCAIKLAEYEHKHEYVEDTQL